MPLFGVTATVRVGGILMAFERLKEQDFRDTFLKLRKPMHADQTDHALKERGPRGPHKALHPATLARYAREGKRRNRKILARLPMNRLTIATQRALTMSSRVRWSGVHFRGGVAGRGARIPQRQFFWISRQFLRVAKIRFEEALMLRWNRS